MTIAGEDIECARDEKYTQKSSSKFVDFEVQCPDVDVVCGTSSRPFACKYGYFNDATAECVCNLGFTGDACDTESDADVSEAVWSTTTTREFPEGAKGSEPSQGDAEYMVCIEGMSEL